MDVLVARGLRAGTGVSRGKNTLERIVSMLVRLVQSTDVQGGREGGRRRERRGTTTTVAEDDDEDNDKDSR